MHWQLSINGVPSSCASSFAPWYALSQGSRRYSGSNLAFQLDLPWVSGNDCVASLLLVAGSLPALNAAQELQNWKLSAGLGKTEAGSFFTACDILVAYPYKGMPDYSLPPLIIPWISSISFRYYVTILKFLWSCYLFHRKCPPSRSVCANTWATVGLLASSLFS